MPYQAQGSLEALLPLLCISKPPHTGERVLEYQVADALRVGRGELGRQRPTEGMAHQHYRLGHPQGVQRPQQVGVRAASQVVEDRTAALGRQEGHGLGRVHGTAPAQAHREIAFLPEEHLGLPVDVHVARVGRRVVGHHHLHSALSQQAFHPLQGPGLPHRVLGGQEHGLPAQLGGGRLGLLHLAGAEKHPGGNTEIEYFHGASLGWNSRIELLCPSIIKNDGI